jgi:signal peptidase I
VGGDTIKCCSNGKLTVNGTPLDEPYVLDETATKDKTFEVTVRDGYLWVMGDNRGNSSDSRFHLGDPGGGQVSEDAVVGKAWLRVWPLGRAGFIHKPSQFEAVNGQ